MPMGRGRCAENIRVARRRRSVRFARDGYDAGKFNYLEVLDAQRTLF